MPDVVFEARALAADRQDASRFRCRAAGRGDGQSPSTPRRHARGWFRARGRGRAIDAALGELLAGEPGRRARDLARLALSELCGLGPLDRIWADRTDPRGVRGWTRPPSMSNAMACSSSRRRDFATPAHLAELVGRLVRAAVTGAVLFHLRDGGEGMVIFPPAAPAGPVLVLRRGEPGNATFERLIAAGTLDRPMADLLRIAARCRLNMLVVGPGEVGQDRAAGRPGARPLRTHGS